MVQTKELEVAICDFAFGAMCSSQRSKALALTSMPGVFALQASSGGFCMRTTMKWNGASSET